ncbi:unnamed protein product [Blumeria hordei]|uniref:Pre-mRNA polyadenylation factor Fip1 domain-containing protein n=1 Tax=Blumeria hordei TaxID=2867405 RepID=A0A383UJL2_BLUHO|nr:unnamed protein product [Blumeria hordei]
MEVDEDDDFYAPEESSPEISVESNKSEPVPTPNLEDGGLEEGEEEEDDDSGDSDIDIITERKDGSKTTPTPSKYNEIRSIPQRVASGEASKLGNKKALSKATLNAPEVELPGVSISKIDVNVKPVYEPAGKPITQVNIDEDLPENEKPWRRPGTDITDYFNYGFDEFSWALYASKQEAVRSEYSADKIALNGKKLFEDMNMMMAMGAIPSMVPGATSSAQLPGMEGMDMQAMMQQMVAAGVDPTHMDSVAMFATMQGSQGGAAGATGSQGGFAQGQNQFGFDQTMANSADGRARANNSGRGGRGRRGW